MSEAEGPFVREVRRQARQMSQGKRRSFWHGLGLVGAIGWTVSVPAAAGALGGHWLDLRLHTGVFWALSLLTLGLGAGCLSAWRYANRELRP